MQISTCKDTEEYQAKIIMILKNKQLKDIKINQNKSAIMSEISTDYFFFFFSFF